PIARNRRLSSSIPARPYICRFNSFNLLMQPSTRPLLHGYVSAFITASMSCSRLLAKPLRGASEDRAAWSSHALSASALRSVRMLLNSCRREYASRADGDASRTIPRKQRHTARRVYQRLRDEDGYEGAESSIRRVVAQLRRELDTVGPEPFFV